MSSFALRKAVGLLWCAERIHNIQHRLEAARCEAADVRARSATLIANMSAKLAEVTANAVKFEMQLLEANDMVKIKTYDSDAARVAAKVGGTRGGWGIHHRGAALTALYEHHTC